MMHTKSFMLALALLGLSTTLLAQQTIVSASRSIDWTRAGVSGGIPTRTTICATLNPGATAAQITSTIGNCPAGQVVKLNAGTYNLDGGIDFGGNSNVTLRGAGADRTFLVFTDYAACLGQYGTICIRGNQLSYYGPGPPTHVVNWTGGYGKGTTSVTLSATTGLSVGMRMVLDQLNDSSDTGDIYVCQTKDVCTEQGGITNGQAGRAQHQIVKVTGINGTTVTFTPGVYMPNYRSGQNPQAWWGDAGDLAGGDGVEDLSIDSTNMGGTSFRTQITIIFAYDSWVKGVRGINCPTPKSCINLYHTDHVTIKDNYFYGSTNYTIGSTTYGVDTFGSYDALIENNIFHHRTSPFVSNGGAGLVFAYNYVFDDYYPISANWMQASQYSHEGGNGMILHEGNEGVGIKGDIIHGTSNLFTYFRNYMHGWEPGKTAETSPVNLYAYNRFYNFVGNVLGESSYHRDYGTGMGTQTSIWRFGRDYSTIGADPVAAGTIMRWGNYDTVTGAARFAASEVPSAGLGQYSNPVPPNQTIPASFYLPGKPAWFGSVPWPPIGPDVTGGFGPGGHAYKLPARLCYENTAKDSNGILTAFNATTCYGSGSNQPPPAAPQNLRIIP
jgi:hypothetical protein